jgi:SAM-dependent methyltransferase
MQSSHEIQSPSPWVLRWALLVRPGAEVLDLACGHGRHARHFAARGCRVLAVDRDEAALASLAAVTGIVTRVADLEGAAWPLASTTFDAVVITNYLHRPLFGPILAALRPGGVLIYDTFMLGNERFGRPSNPNFLLRPGELLDVVRGQLEVVAFEQGQVETPKPAIVQRLCAVKGAVGGVTIG